LVWVTFVALVSGLKRTVTSRTIPHIPRQAAITFRSGWDRSKYLISPFPSMMVMAMI
jgi:hypothetical protein